MGSGIQVFSQVNNTLCLTDFYMEMSKGVSLLRTTQSLLTGRTILYAWMNGYSTLQHNIAPGKCIVIKVKYGLQLHFKICLNTSDRKKQQQK